MGATAPGESSSVIAVGAESASSPSPAHVARLTGIAIAALAVALIALIVLAALLYLGHRRRRRQQERRRTRLRGWSIGSDTSSLDAPLDDAKPIVYADPYTVPSAERPYVLPALEPLSALPSIRYDSRSPSHRSPSDQSGSVSTVPPMPSLSLIAHLQSPSDDSSVRAIDGRSLAPSSFVRRTGTRSTRTPSDETESSDSRTVDPARLVRRITSTTFGIAEEDDDELGELVPVPALPTRV